MYSSVTHIFSKRDIDAVAAHLECTVRMSVSQAWAPGWPDEIEAALLDAVFSARAPYGTPDTGVRRVVSRWRAHRSTEEPDGLVMLDDTAALTRFHDRSDELAEILGNRQRVAGNYTTKAEAVTRVAAVLSERGVPSADHLTECDELRADVIAIPGVGIKTWECLHFALGARTDNAVDLLRSFASDAAGRPLDADDTKVLLHATADALGIARVNFEHAVWRYQRRIGVTVSADSAGEVGVD